MAIHRIESLDLVPAFSPSAVAVGSYDGVHRGHRAVIAHLRAEAASRGLRAVLVTFQPNPRIFFGREREPFLLTDLDERLDLLGRTGVDEVVVLPFDRPLASLVAADFLGKILIDRLGARLFHVGHDQAIGKDQVRGPEAIGAVAAPLGLAVETMGAIEADREPISSTRIRQLVRAGEMRMATDLLGDPYPISGTVVHGDARGRALGYPTANIAPADPFKLLPPPGVYVATGELPGGSAQGMLYIGTRPTFGERARIVELYLMDFAGELYGTTIRASVRERLRGDMTFGSAEDLVRQIRRDEERTREFLLRVGNG